MERSDRRAVVAVLGVVVVLDRDRVARAQPGQQGGSSLAGQHDAGGVLVGGRQHDGVGVGVLELVDPCSGFVDPDQNRLQAGVGGDQGVIGVARVL